MISSVFPDAKILFLLRNPVERALSNYRFSVNNDLEHRSLEDIFINDAPKPVLENEISVDPFDYLARGDYERYISNYQRCFSDEQIKVMLFDEVIGNSAEIENLYDYLGVDKTFVGKSIYDVVNASEKERGASEVIRDYLKDYYEEPVARLGTLIDKDLSGWVEKTSA